MSAGGLDPVRYASISSVQKSKNQTVKSGLVPEAIKSYCCEVLHYSPSFPPVTSSQDNLTSQYHGTPKKIPRVVGSAILRQEDVIAMDRGGTAKDGES